MKFVQDKVIYLPMSGAIDTIDLVVVIADFVEGLLGIISASSTMFW